MHCAIFNCGKLAVYPFACCGKDHGWELKMLLHAMENGDPELKKFYVSTTPEELAHYRKIAVERAVHKMVESINEQTK